LGGLRKCGADQDTLDVPVSFFFEGAAELKVSPANLDESLGLLRTAGTLRLVRAFENMPADARAHFLALIEIIARGRPAPRGKRRRLLH